MALKNLDSETNTAELAMHQENPVRSQHNPRKSGSSIQEASRSTITEPSSLSREITSSEFNNTKVFKGSKESQSPPSLRPLTRPTSESITINPSLRPQPSAPSMLSVEPLATACVSCKRAHLRCNRRRPCSHCLRSGKEDAYVAVYHKK